MKYKFKIRENFSRYDIFEDGDVYDNLTGRYKNAWIVKGIHYYTLFNDQNKKQTFKIDKLMYEAFYDETITLADFIQHKDGDDKNFHYKNLKKISRKKMQQRLSTKPLILDPTKKWVIAKDFDNYKVSDYADIYSIKLNKMMKIKHRADGYDSINLINNKYKEKQVLINRLIYDSFIGIKDKTNEIDHLNKIRNDNRLINLAEKTSKSNAANRSHTSKKCQPILQYTLEGKFVKEWDSMYQIKDVLNYHRGSISRCCTGKAKTAYKYTWKYKNSVQDLTNYVTLKTPCGILTKYKINKSGVIVNQINLINAANLKNGYEHVTLDVNGVSKIFRVNRLVASSFSDTDIKNLVVNHLDENKLNNNIENLEPTTQRNNVIYSLGIKINQLDLKTLKVLNTYNCINDAYIALKKPLGHGINDTCKGKAIQAYGYKWEYVK